MTDYIYVDCLLCKTKNRIPKNKASMKCNCGSCKSPLQNIFQATDSQNGKPHNKSFNFKTASNADIKLKYKHIADETGELPGFNFRVSSELEYLTSILYDKEQLVALTSGQVDGKEHLLALTDRRIILIYCGVFYGLRQVAIDFDNISSVSCNSSLFHGKITIQEISCTRVISAVSATSVTTFTNKAQDTIATRKASRHTSELDLTENDFVSKLERLAALLEKGIINKEEFNQQKAKIMA